MAKTKIEWATHSINPVKGLCPMDCKDLQGKPYCYARKMYRRFKWNPEIRFDVEALMKPIGTDWKSHYRFFVGSTMELFGNWIKKEWWDEIITTCKVCSEHTFIFLTKCPQNLPKEWPDNCWVGASVTNQEDVDRRLPELCKVEAIVNFVSCEPFLGKLNLSPYLANPVPGGSWFEDSKGVERYDLTGAPLNGINWVIIGSRTQPTRHPPKAWVDEIITACDIAGIPVFIKEPMASFYNLHRQEFPK